MAKYIFCILFGIFLRYGDVNLVPDKELQEFRTEAGTTTIQSHNKSQSFYRSKAVVKQSGKENNSFQKGNMMENMVQHADGLLGNSLLSRTTSLPKF